MSNLIFMLLESLVGLPSIAQQRRAKGRFCQSWVVQVWTLKSGLWSKKTMTGESKFHPSIVWVILIPSLKTFLGKTEHDFRQSTSSWNEAENSGPALSALTTWWPWSCWEGEDTASGVQLLHISSYTPGAAPGSILLVLELYWMCQPGVWECWASLGPPVSCCGQNSPFP